MHVKAGEGLAEAPAPATSFVDAAMPAIRLFQAAALFGPAKEIGIVHDGALYRLRVTRAGKLILTK